MRAVARVKVFQNIKSTLFYMREKVVECGDLMIPHVRAIIDHDIERTVSSCNIAELFYI